MRRIIVPTLLIAASAVLAPASAQIPDEFENLQVLPEETSKAELVEMMKSFAFALDVRCEHCHVGEPGESLDTFDFVSDEREPKRIAREMMKMTGELNRTMPELVGREVVEVQCATCHRGLARPLLIRDALAEADAEGGVEAAITAYRDLRETYYGRGTYDFSEEALTGWASDLARGGRPDDALAGLGLAEELFPDSVQVVVLLGEVHLIRGDRDRAAAEYRRALERDPENGVAKFRLASFEKELDSGTSD